MIYQLGDAIPCTDQAIYIDDSATIIGQVVLASNVTVWPSAVLRGDVALISIGENSNIQDNVTIHADHGIPCEISKNVTVGHNVILHSCFIDDNVIVGMGSTLLNHSRIAKNCIIGAGSLVTHHLPYQEGCLIMGAPAKIVRQLTAEEIQHIQDNADHYRENGLFYKQKLRALPSSR